VGLLPSGTVVRSEKELGIKSRVQLPTALTNTDEEAKFI
jgi:hypothetical protein